MKKYQIKSLCNISRTIAVMIVGVVCSHSMAQIIDDEAGNTLVSASSMDKDLKIENGGNVEAAKKVGEAIAKKAVKAGITKVVFDRGGYQYHGRVQAFADAARENGLEF